MTATMHASPPGPARPFRLAMLVPGLVVNVALPIAILKTLEALGVAQIWALGAGCIPILLNSLRDWVRSRRLDPVGLLMIASIATGPAATLISGEVSSRIATDCVLNSAWGVAFLSSLLLSRPVMFFLIRAIVAGDDASRADTWNGLWRYGSFRAAMRSITAAWGVVYFIEVLAELGLAGVLTSDTLFTVTPIMNAGATLALIVLTRQRMRAMRERFEIQEHLTWPL